MKGEYQAFAGPELAQKLAPHIIHLLRQLFNRGRIAGPVHDGFGLWLAARRLHQGKFIRARDWQGDQVQLDSEQLKALVLGLPWYQAGRNNSISLL